MDETKWKNKKIGLVFGETGTVIDGKKIVYTEVHYPIATDKVKDVDPAKIKFKGIYCTVEKERIVKENYTISDIRRGLAIPKLKGIDVATIDQYQELLDECTFQLVASGIRFYGPNEETITFKYNIRDLPGYFNYYVKSPNIVDKAFVFTNRGKNGEMNKPHIEAVELDYKYPVGIQLIKVKK